LTARKIFKVLLRLLLKHFLRLQFHSSLNLGSQFQAWLMFQDR
jgi:hypothetical protein